MKCDTKGCDRDALWTVVTNHPDRIAGQEWAHAYCTQHAGECARDLLMEGGGVVYTVTIEGPRLDLAATPAAQDGQVPE